MDLILSRLAHLEEQARLQASSVALLVAKDEAHTSALAHLSSEVARLSSLNNSKDIFIRQLEAKVFPEGFWIWEKVGDGLEGRWTWSEDKHRKPRPAKRIGPPTSLLSLPNELLEIILRLALPNQRDHLRASRVSIRFLDVLAPMAYQEVTLFTPAQAVSFILPRISELNPSTARVNSPLTPHKLRVYQQDENIDFSPSTFLPLALVHPSDPHPILLPHLIVEEGLDFVNDSLIKWLPVLRHVNPANLSLVDVDRYPSRNVPSTERVSSNQVQQMTFLKDWNRLRIVCSSGQCSSLVVPGSPNKEEDASLFRNCFEKPKDGSGVELEMLLRTVYKDGRSEAQLLEGLGLSRILEDEDVATYGRAGDERSDVWAVLKRKGDELE